MSLYQKYRPSQWAEVKGNTEVVETLVSMIGNRETCPHAFLLHGPTGCGKTTLGRIIAGELGCRGSDFVEVDSADFRGIDTVRDIRRNAQYSAMEGECRVWLIDEVHKMTNDAQNALLKILEDTPEHVYFILATTEPNKLLSTIRGRCSQFQVKPLSDQQMFRLLKVIALKEDKTVAAEVLEQIVMDSLGHPRNAIQILEQVLNVNPEKQLAMAKRTAAEQSQSIELCRALMNKSGWKAVNEILKGMTDQEPESVRRAVLGYAQAVLLKSDNPLAGLILEQFREPFYDCGFPGLTLACYLVVKN